MLLAFVTKFLIHDSKTTMHDIIYHVVNDIISSFWKLWRIIISA